MPDPPALPSTPVTLALAGDVMLGRHVNDALAEHGPEHVWGDMSPLLWNADAFLVNLECAITADVVIFSIHWGPNMRERPPEPFRHFAPRVIGAGATIFRGHSAHVVQAVEPASGPGVIFYDTGDFVDDYAVDPWTDSAGSSARRSRSRRTGRSA